MKTTFKTAKVIRAYTVKMFGHNLTVPLGATVSNKTATGPDDSYRFWQDFHEQAKLVTGFSNSILAHDLGHYGMNVPADHCEPYTPKVEELFLNSRVLPEIDEQIVILSIHEGKLTRKGPYTILDRKGFSLTNEEYVMSDGSRHHVKNFYPNNPTGGPDHAPWNLVRQATCSIYARLSDEIDATRVLISEYRCQCIKVAAEMRVVANGLESWMDVQND